MIQIEEKICFHPEVEVMEIDFEGLNFNDASVVHPAYDELERRLSPTGRKWFFLINYTNCEIAPEAWSAFALRGKQLNLAYSLGSVRYGAAAATRDEIDAAASVEKFDANLVSTRDAALVRIGELRQERAAKGEIDVSPDRVPSSNHELGGRIEFHEDIGVMEVDFSESTFSDASVVNTFYDELERRLATTRRKWYFLVNYRKCRIFPEAWFAFAHRGKRLNLGYSLGTVRYDASEATQAEINRRAGDDQFNPNLCASRDEALGRIDALRSSGQAMDVAS